MPTTRNLALQIIALLGTACTSVHAAPVSREAAVARGPRYPASPYLVELIGEGGEILDTYRSGGRFYVLGGAGQRYSVRVDNPTERRVEAVISIDGLDVIDGRDADFVGKRGYIVEPHDTLLVEGFRTSDSAVAAFRFSSVGESYAGRKGRARNVGVIGVAIFEERGRPAVLLPAPVPPPYVPMRPYGRLESDERGAVGKASASPSPSPSVDAEREAPAESASRSAPAPTSAPASASASLRSDQAAGQGRAERQPASRPGLGTAFGEERFSQVSFTRFVRRHARTPDAFAEIRYNDASGLAALGIVLDPPWDGDDLALRESADPFPGRSYAQPPR
jgi:hypothetical protein